MRIAACSLLLIVSSAFAGGAPEVVNGVLQSLKYLPGEHTTPASNEIAGVCEIKGRGDVQISAPCNGVTVLLIKEGGKEAGRMATNRDGEFKFINLLPGLYDVSIESSKFKLAKKVKNLKPGSAYLLTLQ